MKMLKKLAALILAATMVLVLFTACGGGAGSNMKEDKEAEEKVMSQIRGQSTSAASLQNDRDLQKVAAAHLEEDLKGGIEIFGHKFSGDVHVEGEDKQYLTITVTGNYTFEGTLLNALLKQIESNHNVSTGIKADVKQSGNWSKVGVVVRTSNNQSFVAIAFQIKNPNYKK